MSNLAAETLIKKREQLIEEQTKMNLQFQEQINDLDMAIEAIYGRPAKEVIQETKYDDESPDYIKGSAEEI